MNDKARKLHFQILKALEQSPLVKVDVPEYAAALSVSLRSAQRYIKQLQDRPEYEVHRRAHDGARYFKRPDSPPLGVIMENAKWGKCTDLHSFVVCVVSDSLSSLYINTKKKEDLKSVSSATTQTTQTTNGDSGSESPTIWYEETDGDFQTLANSVCTVCRMNPLLLLPEDEKKIAQLFRAGVSPEEIEKRYSYMRKPNYWYHMHWKGIRGAWPTITDVMQTWEQSGGYVYRKHHDWPPVKEIQDAMIFIMQEYGRRKQKLAMEKYAQFGYDEIAKRIPGGYYAMTVMTIDSLRIQIAIAVREIKKTNRREKELA